MPIFIIEHLEPKLWAWCLAEYEHTSKIVGKKNVWFTNLNSPQNCSDKIKNLGITKNKSVIQLNLKNSCLLDPKAKKELTPNEAKNFNYFIFGGILGNAPAEGRTRILSENLNCEKRKLGPKQMSTDTAVLVTKMIVDGKRLQEINFIDEPEIQTDKNESVILPYRYVAKNKKPVICKKIQLLLRKGF
ncbi:hypothetical protein HYV79_04075 [Candidatus Woesearchaeota archaeon]|nr:hypothetical protein [Candidatus Woesearchaeota archaeon]